jgi:hypothetical protein
VIARNSAFTYKGRAVGVKQVAQELGVRFVLEGSVRKAGNRVRITGQLIDTTTGAHIWADRFDGALDDVFELQDQVADCIRLARQALETARGDPDTMWRAAYTLFILAGDAAVAETLIDRALTLNPNAAGAWTVGG